MDISPEHLLVIVLISSRRVSATVAWLHPVQGEKVVAHKHIDCTWRDLSSRGRQQTVADVVQIACDSAGVEPYSAYISMSDGTISSQMATGYADLGEELMLTHSEKAQALIRARHEAIPGEREILHAIPVHWSVRSRAGEREITDPVGERGSRLTGHVLLVTARRGYREELASLLDTSNLHLDGVIAPPVAVYHGIASRLRKSGSTILIDCGARHTAVLVARKQRLVYLHTHPFGGDDLTDALIGELNIQPDQAENLKREIDLGTQSAPGGLIDGQQYLWREVQERHRLVAPATRICADRLRDFFTMVARGLREGEYVAQVGHVHLVGRASSLGGLPLLAKDIFGLPVTLGTGAKDRDPSAELLDLMISGVVRVAAEERRHELGRTPLSGRITRAWKWFTRQLE